MNYYVSKDNVIEAIEYFRNAGFEADDMLDIYLVGKSQGVTTTFPITYGKQLSGDKRDECLKAIWMLGGLFDSSEVCRKRGLMFPSGFGKSVLYQPGTDFSGAVGRVRDTIKQKNIPMPVYNNNDSILTLRSNYRELLTENYLKGNKISLSHLAAWLFRFTSFDFENEPDERKFTRVVEKAIRRFFKITKNDFLWLFENDLSNKRLTPKDTGMTGAEIRALFAFKDGENPEVQSSQDPNKTQSSVVGREEVERYLALNGDNPSDADIFDILKTKKQIVLTGVPGVGKSRYTQRLCTNDFFAHTKTIQFHANYAYEDFIGAETLKPEGNGTKVDTRRGVFLDFAVQAMKALDEKRDENFLFVIDELNRGNIAEIFGETILALDRNYEVTLSRTYEGVSEFRLPENLYIVATMNTSDRNIAFLDLAIRRRFAFVSLLPNYDFLSEEVKLENVDLGNVLRVINQRILNTLKDPELVLGQSYFIPPENEGKFVWNYEQFKNQFNYVVLPTIKEYSFNEPSAVNTIVGEALGDGIQDIDEFKTVFEAEFIA